MRQRQKQESPNESGVVVPQPYYGYEPEPVVPQMTQCKVILPDGTVMEMAIALPQGFKPSPSATVPQSSSQMMTPSQSSSNEEQSNEREDDMTITIPVM